MIDIVLIAILAGVAWCVASEGFAGALQTAVICIISGLLAMNFFEPMAGALSGMLPAAYNAWADAISLLGLYAILVTLMRLGVEKVAPGFPDTKKPLYEGGTLVWCCSFRVRHNGVYSHRVSYGSRAERIHGLHTGAKQSV